MGFLMELLRRQFLFLLLVLLLLFFPPALNILSSNNLALGDHYEGSMPKAKVNPRKAEPRGSEKLNPDAIF